MRQPFLVLLLLSPLLLGAAPSRTQTYTKGETIKSEEVTENEDNIFSYLQAGVDTYRDASIAAAKLQDASVTAAKLGTGAVTTTIILDGTILTDDISTGGVATSDILDNTITADDLNATLTFSDGDFMDLSPINTSGTSEGFRLPQATSCTSGTAEGQLCWDTDNDALSIGSGSSAQVGQLVNAWVEFNGTGTVSIVASFNVTSITDNGTGTYTVNFTRAFAGATNTCVVSSNAQETAIGGTVATTRNVSTYNSSGTAVDANPITMMCLGPQ